MEKYIFLHVFKPAESAESQKCSCEKGILCIDSRQTELINQDKIKLHVEMALKTRGVRTGADACNLHKKYLTYVSCSNV